LGFGSASLVGFFGAGASGGCEHAFVSIKGSPYARFRRALETGNLALIRTAAAELPQVNLDDALRICLVIREREPGSFDRAACRWLARYATQRRATLARLAVAVAALELMREDPDLAHEVLERL
jgi:hypothetical protein